MKNFYPIKSKKELEMFIKTDRIACFGSDKISFEKKLRNPFKTNLFNFLKLLRKYEYLCYKRDSSKNAIKSKLTSFQIKLIDIKKNNLSLKLDIEINPFHCVKVTKSLYSKQKKYTETNMIIVRWIIKTIKQKSP